MLIGAGEDILACLVIRLVGAVLQELMDEWQAAKRYFSQESTRRLYDPQPLVMAELLPFTLAPVH